MRLFILIALLMSAPAMAYDTGSMSCDDIGQFAAATVTGKENGRTYQQQLTSLDHLVPPEYFTERKILTTITHDLYKEDWAKHLTPDGAYASFKADCMVGKGG